jgi:hypothetical protein
VFIHGLWLLASSWDRWAEHFAEAGYAPVSPGWPDDPDTVEEAIAVPPTLSRAAYTRQQKNPGVTEFTEIPGRGHALTIDDGWQEVADTALTFIRRFA